jgi:hypothetical protein
MTHPEQIKRLSVLRSKIAEYDVRIANATIAQAGETEDVFVETIERLLIARNNAASEMAAIEIELEDRFKNVQPPVDQLPITGKRPLITPRTLFVVLTVSAFAGLAIMQAAR